ncbi:unnamed protein product [Agarophyton chilense]
MEPPPDVDAIVVTSRNATQSVLINLGIGVAIFVVALIIYDLLRYFAPAHAFPRAIFAPLPASRNYDKTPLSVLPPLPSFPLSWVMRTLRYSEIDTVRTHGLDVALFIRFLGTQAKLFATLTVFTAFVLYPTYITAENRFLPADDPNRVIAMEIATLSNVPKRSARLWVTLFSEIFVVATILLFLYRDMLKYAKYRRIYRARFDNPANYAIIVQDIPSFLRTPSDVYAIFDKVFPTQVLRVHLVRDAQPLLRLKLKYVTALDRYLFYSARAGVRVAPDAVSNAPPPVPLPLPLPLPLPSNSPSPSSASSSLSSSPHPDEQQPQQQQQQPDIAAPSATSDSILGPHQDVSPPSPSKMQRCTRRSSATASHRSEDRVSRTTSRTTLFPSTDANLWKERQRLLLDQVNHAEQSLDQTAPITGCAIVVFRSKRVATLAATAPVWINASECRVSRAAEPRAVNWNRLSITPYTRRIRQYTSFFVLTAMAIFWTVPATSIQALNNLQELADKWPDSFLTGFIENNPGFARLLQGILPPLLLYVLLLIVPLIIRLVVNFERIHSRVLLEAKIRNFIFFFYIMSNFFYVVVIGSVFQKLKELFENPAQIVGILSVSVPAQSTFLMKYVLINAFLGSTLNLLNIGRIIVRPFLLMGAKTPRERRNSDAIFSQYPFAKMYALCCMVSLISFVYSTIAPVICAVATMYFSIGYLCHKQQLLYSHKPQFEGGGFMFRDAWTGLLVGLYFHQLSMIGIFGLKLATAQAILSVFSLVASLWFQVYCRKTFLFRAKHGSLVDQADMDDEEGLRDEIPEHFAELYLHPGLRSVDIIKEEEFADITYECKPPEA